MRVAQSSPRTWNFVAPMPARCTRSVQTASSSIDRLPSARANLLERDARVDQRADDHVARRTREAVEVQDLHNLTILLDAPRRSFPASTSE